LPNYQVVGGWEKVWDGNSSLSNSFSDGASNTILFAEKYARCVGGVTNLEDGGTMWMDGVIFGQNTTPGMDTLTLSIGYLGTPYAPVFGGGSSPLAGYWWLQWYLRFLVQPANPLQMP